MRYFMRSIPISALAVVCILTFSALSAAPCYAQHGHGGGGGGGHFGGGGGGHFGGGGGAHFGGGGGHFSGGGAHFNGGHSGGVHFGGGNVGGGNFGGGNFRGGNVGGTVHHGGSFNGGGSSIYRHNGSINGGGNVYRHYGNGSYSGRNFGNSYFNGGSNLYRGGSRYGVYPYSYGNYYGGYGGYRGYGYGNGLNLLFGLGNLLGSPYYYGYGYPGYYGYGNLGSGYYGSGYYGSGYGYPGYSTYVPSSSYGTSTAPTTTYSVPTTVAGGTVIPTSGAAASYEEAAEEAFREHRYEDAARNVDHAIVEDAGNGRLYLFASQVLFALGDYQASAAALQRGAGMLDRNDWGYVVQNYAKLYTGSDYVTQMNKLIDFIDKNPDAAYAHFLRGYHYVYLNHTDAARKELTKAVELEPRDKLAAELLKQVGGTVPEAAKPDAVKPATPPAEASASVTG